MIKGENILLLSSDLWRSEGRRSKEHITIRLIKENKVLYVESIGIRHRSMAKGEVSIKLIKERLGRFFKGLNKLDKNLGVLPPLILPFHKSQLIGRINKSLLNFCITRAMKKMDFDSLPIVIACMPTWANFCSKVRRKILIYYLLDKFSRFYGAPREEIDEMDEKLIREADIVIAISQPLYEEAKKIKPDRTYFVPHGVDFNIFQTEDPDILFKEIPNLKHPVIGYFGLIENKAMFDSELVEYMAKKKPEWSFVLIGKVDFDNSYLKSFPNIHFLGIKPYEKLSEYACQFDVCTIPFRQNELIYYSRPLKVMEYLAMGKPIVSTWDPLNEKELKNLIYVRKDPDSFIEGISKALSEDNPELKKVRKDFARKNTWDNAYNKICDIINENLKTNKAAVV